MKWEYMIFEKSLIDTETVLNQLGGQGWELVAVDEKYFYFKRERRVL